MRLLAGEVFPNDTDDGQIVKLIGTTKNTPAVRTRTHRNQQRLSRATQ